jgi:hypothetical protein
VGVLRDIRIELGDVRAAVDGMRGALDDVRGALDDLRIEIRQSSLRQERVMQQFERRLEMLEAEFADSRDERRAHTQALWRLVDRLGEGPAPAA